MFRGRAVDLLFGTWHDYSLFVLKVPLNPNQPTLFGTSQFSVPWQTLVFPRLPDARSVAELAVTEKDDKYSGLAADYLF